MRNKKINIICIVMSVVLIVCVFGFIIISGAKKGREADKQKKDNVDSSAVLSTESESKPVEDSVPQISENTFPSIGVSTEKPDIDVSVVTRNPDPEVVDVEIGYDTKEVSPDE